MIDNGQDCVSHGDHGFLRAPAERQALVKGRQIGVLGVRGPLCGFHQMLAQGGIAFASATTQPLARALMIAR